MSFGHFCGAVVRLFSDASIYQSQFQSSSRRRLSASLAAFAVRQDNLHDNSNGNSKPVRARPAVDRHRPAAGERRRPPRVDTAATPIAGTRSRLPPPAPAGCVARRTPPLGDPWQPPNRTAPAARRDVPNRRCGSGGKDFSRHPSRARARRRRGVETRPSSQNRAASRRDRTVSGATRKEMPSASS